MKITVFLFVTLMFSLPLLSGCPSDGAPVQGECDPLNITTTSLSDAYLDVSYSATILAVGGYGEISFSWEARNGVLPAGLSIDSQTGTISGTPTVTGTFNLLVIAVDQCSGIAQSAARDFQLTVTEKPNCPQLSITTTELPAGQSGVSYNVTIETTGGYSDLNFNWQATSGNLPAGLSLDPASGVISGTPTAPGNFELLFTVTDSCVPDPLVASKTLYLSICVIQEVTPIGTNFFADISQTSGIQEDNYDPNPQGTIYINDHSLLAFADINGDGYDDIVMHNIYYDPMQGTMPHEHLVFLNNGDKRIRFLQ